jgi:molecular chaperone DnaJ
MEIKIPAGVDNGSRLRVSGEGEAGVHGGPPGDLYVVIYVKEHEIFERQENNLYCVVPVAFSQVALGTEILIPTLEGQEHLKIPEGTQSGSIFRLKGKGIPSLNGRGRGDLFVTVNVVTPSKLTREQRKLLEQLAAVSEIENKPLEKSLLNKVKDIFG